MTRQDLDLLNRELNVAHGRVKLGLEAEHFATFASGADPDAGGRSKRVGQVNNLSYPLAEEDALPFIEIEKSPFANHQATRIYYREEGRGVPLIFLHGGWGYEIYPFDQQIAAFKDRFRILIPDRSGYGRSGRIDSLPADFHQRAAEEMSSFLDALGIDQAFLWGHSDGSVIAAKMALAAPARFSGLILEAFHFYRVKPASRPLFEMMRLGPVNFSERIAAVLARDHGEDDWRKIVEMNGAAWAKIAEESPDAKSDLYDGRLRELQTAAVFIHGRQDPRTEPGELEAVRRELPHVPIRLIEAGRHSPHNERATASESVRLAREFLDAIVVSS